MNTIEDTRDKKSFAAFTSEFGQSPIRDFKHGTTPSKIGPQSEVPDETAEQTDRSRND